MNQLGQEEPVGTGRLLLTTGVIALLFAVWAYWMQPGPQQKKAPEPAKEAQSAPTEAVAPALPPAAPVAAQPVSPVHADSRQTVTLENDDLRLIFDNRGAVLVHAILKRYKERGAKDNDDLVSPLAGATERYPLRLLTDDVALNAAVNGALFHVEQSLKGGSSASFTWADEKGDSVKKVFSLPPKGYEVDLEAELVRDGKRQPEIPIVWGPDLGLLSPEQAKDRYFQQACAVMDRSGQYERITRKKVGADSTEALEQAKGPATWVGVSTNYFAALFIPEKAVPEITVITEAVPAELRKAHPADSALSLAVSYPGSGKLFLGPKEYGRLKAMGGQYFRLLNWGTSSFGNAILYPVCTALLFALKWLFGICRNYGVAIILLTALIKLAFYPLTQRSMVKMKEMGEAMKKLKPQVDRIKAKYKKMPKDMTTRTKMNEEMMALYQREGINPMAQMTGCLPMLLQMPIFIALYTLLPAAIELRGAPFFWWIKDLSVADPYYITPLLMGATMIISTKMTMTTEMEGAQKLMIWAMPLMFVYWCLLAPAGLALYWLANSVLTIGQQYLINRQVAARQEAAQKERKSTPKGPSKPSR